MTLLILAAGMGSRFGGLKQIEPVGPNGEFIIDYSIHDAIKCGFDKVVFIIKEENYDIFRNTIGKRIEGKIKVEYVFQKIDSNKVPSERVKPLGTAHAIYSARNNISDDFVIINADDFYGYEAFLEISNFIKNKKKDNLYGLVGYEVSNTMTVNGQVKRGLLKFDENDNLVDITESSIYYEDDKIVATPLNTDEKIYVNKDDLVSMNMIAFTPMLFQELEAGYEKFLNTKDLMKDEYLIPDVLYKQVSEGTVECKILHTNAVWKGITYSSDLAELKEYIRKQIEKGIYPSSL